MAAPRLADVDSLFARIRAGHHEPAVSDDAAPGADEADAQPALAPDESEPAPEIVVEPAPEPDAAPPVAEATPSAGGRMARRSIGPRSRRSWRRW